MQAAPLPETEYARLMALARYSVLDTGPEESFERITRLVSEVLKVPVTLINFVDQFRQWGKSCVGMDSSEAQRDISFCAWAILDSEVLVVENAHVDPRFADNPMVLGEPHVHLYAGAPLLTPDGHAIGTLCVVDDQPHPFGAREVRLLEGFAAVVMEALELRVRQLELTRQVAASAAQVDDLRRTAAHAETLSAITALFDANFEPEEATLASAELLSQVVEVDWAGLLLRRGETLQLLSAWPPGAAGEAALLSDLDAQRHGLIGTLASQQRALFVDDYPAHPQALPDYVAAGVKAVAVLPLGQYSDAQSGSGPSGQGQYVLAAVRTRTQPWRGSDRALFEAAARSIRGSLERQAHLRAVEEAAGQDALTGLGNRRAFDQAMRILAQLGEPYGLLVADLDGLKAINDQQGHAAGDRLLSQFAAALQVQFLPQAEVYRFGGDEFAALWPRSMDEDEALGRVQRAVQHLRVNGFPSAGASAGVAYRPRADKHHSAADLLRLADERMYAAKRRRKVGAGSP